MPPWLVGCGADDWKGDVVQCLTLWESRLYFDLLIRHKSRFEDNFVRSLLQALHYHRAMNEKRRPKNSQAWHQKETNHWPYFPIDTSGPSPYTLCRNRCFWDIHLLVRGEKKCWYEYSIAMTCMIMFRVEYSISSSPERILSGFTVILRRNGLPSELTA